MTKIKHALRLLIIIVSIIIIGILLEPFRNVSPLLKDYFEVTTELLPLVMSFSIFVTTWFAYDKSRDDNSFFLGASFFVMGLIQLFQMLSHPYMPDFITPNSIEKATTFRFMLWPVSVLFFYLSVHIYRDSLPGIISKYVMFASAIILSLISLTLVLFYPHRLPEVHPIKGDISNAWILMAFMTSIFLLYASYLYTKRLEITKDKNIICLIYGFIIIYCSFFVDFFYIYSGNLLQAAGFYFVYLAMFKSSVEKPYEKLAIAEHKMRHLAEEKYRNLFENANDAIVITDTQDRILSWNKSAESIFGWGADELPEKKLFDVVVPQRLHTEINNIKNDVISGSRTRGFDFINLHKTGKEIDVSMTMSPLLDSDNKIIGMSSIIRDITQRKLAEEALRKSEEQFRSLIENSSDIITILGEAGIIYYLSPSIERSFGYKPQELIGQNISVFIHPDDMPHFTDVFMEKIKNPNITSSIEVRALHKDSSWRILESIGKKLPPDLAVTGMVLNSRDITERKQAEEQIRSSLHEKEVLLREVHHRVKNNMQIISSLLRLQSDFSKDKNIIEMFNESRNRIISMSLVHEKLYRSKDFTKIDLKGYIIDLVNGLFQSYGINMSKIALNANVEDIPLGIDSAIPCGLIINELVTNSLKHAFPGDRKGEIKVILHLTLDNMIELVVSDNGIGIPENLDIKNVKSLGLHLVTMLAEDQLNGSMDINRNIGTEFTIKFRGVK